MFAKLSTLALALPLVSAFTLNTPQGVTTGGLVTFTWTASTTDPAFFSLELVNTIFHNTYAIANNVQTSLGTITITLPQVPPGDGYTAEVIATNNINQVYAQSGDFVVGDVTSASSSAMPTTSVSSASSASSASLPTLSTTPASMTMTTPTAIPLTTATSATFSSASATPSNFHNGAASFKSVSGAAPAAAMVLAAVAGAAVVF